MLAFEPRHEDPHGMSLSLIVAAESADVQTVGQLIDGGADVNAATSSGMTALMCAAEKGRLKVLLMLLEAGADVNKVRNDGVTALALAAFFGHHQVVQELIRRGANVEAPRLHNSLENWARARGFPEVRQLLQEARANNKITEESYPFASAETLNSPEAPVSEHSLAGESKPQLHSADEPEWLEFSDMSTEVSPASVWIAEIEEELIFQSKVPDEIALNESQVNDIQPEAIIHETTRSDTNDLGVNRYDLLDPRSLSDDNPSDHLSQESGTVPDELKSTIIQNQKLEPLNVQGHTEASEGYVDQSEFIPRVQVLDESQVLSGEASFATVVLNQPIEAAPKKSWKQLNSTHEDWTASEVSPHVPILDESQFPPDEAYLDALLLNRGIAPPTYSPMTEFFARSNLNWRRLAMAGLLLVTTSVVATAILVRITEGVISSMPPVTATVEDSTPAQPDAAHTDSTAPVSPDPTPIPRKEMSNSPTSITAEAKPERPSSEGPTIVGRASVEESTPALPEKSKSEILRKPVEQNSKPLSSRVAAALDTNKRMARAEQKHATAKETAVIQKPVTTEESNTRISRAEPFVRPQESPGTAQTSGETKTTLPTGGGIRPRRANN